MNTLQRIRVPLIAFLDGCYILAAYVVAVYVTHPDTPSLSKDMIEHLGFYAIFLMFWCWIAIDAGLWQVGHTEDLGCYLILMFRAAVGAAAFSALVTVPIANKVLEREFLAVFCINTIVAIILLHTLVRGARMAAHACGYGMQSVLVVGANARSANLVRVLQTCKHHGYRVIGFIEDDPARAPLLTEWGIRRLGGCNDLPRVLDQYDVDNVHIALPIRSCHKIIGHMAQICQDRHTRVDYLADLFPVRVAKSNLLYLQDVPLLSLSSIPEAQGELAIKRALDVLIATTLLIVLLPALFLIAVLIKLDSPGPIFFLQERVGCNGRRFKIVKFRSMFLDAEKKRTALAALNEADGPVFKIRDDPRVTRIGRFIRKFSLDEFPQLINVWIGQMSLVGPRPPIPSEVEQYTWDQRRRLSVKPGMTGLWQVSGRSDIRFTQWVELDLKYIDNWSLWQDFIILLRTFQAVIKGTGAA